MVKTDWEEVTFQAPSKVVRAGDNELLIRFPGAPRVDGRRQAGHVDWVEVLPRGVEPGALPTTPAVETLNVGGVQAESLLALTPQSHIYRLHVPELPAAPGGTRATSPLVRVRTPLP